MSTTTRSDEEDAIELGISQEVVMVDSGPSWKSRWVRPNILQNLRLGSDNSDSVANITSSELYISRVDDSSSDSFRASFTKSNSNNQPEVEMMRDKVPAEDEDDESLDFKPNQDWNPDDSEVATGDDVSNGELSFWASKKTTELCSPESPCCPLASSTSLSTESQQGEELVLRRTSQNGTKVHMLTPEKQRVTQPVWLVWGIG